MLRHLVAAQWAATTIQAHARRRALRGKQESQRLVIAEHRRDHFAVEAAAELKQQVLAVREQRQTASAGTSNSACPDSPAGLSRTQGHRSAISSQT